MPQFDSKIFNAEAFQKYRNRIQDLKRNELLKAGVLRTRNDLKASLTEQAGGNYITIPMKGLLDGTPLNYDGQTNITATSTKTYSQSMVVIGRAKAWVEKDFSDDITGTNFMSNVAEQVNKYWENIDQDTLLHILKGIFSMTGAENQKFVTAHTNDITAKADPRVNATTLNTTAQKATGDNKNIFTVAIMNSAVATNLENLQVLEYYKYTDANGVQRELQIASWNGRAVLVDDSIPVEETAATYAKTSDSDIVAGKTYYTRSGNAGSYVYTPVTNPQKSDLGNYYEETSPAVTKYTTYVLGNGAFDYCDCGAKVPNEMFRDPKTNGGEDTLITRQRKLFAPYGISFTKAVMTSLSPKDEELENGANWELVNDGAASKSYINHKAIPIARIISLG